MIRMWRNHKAALVIAGTALLIVAAGLSALGLALGQAYPHSWCAPVVTAETAHGGTEGQLEARLAGADTQGAPVSGLLSDLAVYDADADLAGNSLAADGYAALAREGADLRAAGADLQQIARQCGEPAGAYKKWNV